MARNNQNQAARERGCSASFPMIPLIVIILAQVGTSSDNAALGIAVQELVGALGATVADVQMANLAYSLVAGSCMIAGGMIGVVVGWRKTLRIGLALAILGEAVVVTATSMDVFTWGGRFLVGLGASFITPSVLGLIPALYEGHARATAFGFVAAASAVSALVPIPFGILLDAAGFRVTFGVIALYFLGVLISTPRKYSAITPNVTRKPAASRRMPNGMGTRADTAEAAATKPKAVARACPSYSAGMSPSTDGVMKLAPNPTRKRPPQVNTSIDVAVTTTASPRMASAKPMRSVLRQPTTTPIMPPAIMHEPATSEYARFAICTSATVAPSAPTSSCTAMPSAALSLDVPT